MSVPPRVRFRLGVSTRLKRNRDFQKLKQAGKRMVAGCLIANWQETPAATSRLGVVTSGRIGPAVVRSRARRLMRESFRMHRHDLVVNIDLVLIARPSIVGKTRPEVTRDFLTILGKTGLLRKAEN